MTMRVTDLEKFAMEEIWRPYWPIQPFPGGEVNGYGNTLRHSLDQTVTALREHPDWREVVVGRLARIGVGFPPYVVHPLADLIREEVDIWRADRYSMNGLNEAYQNTRGAFA